MVSSLLFLLIVDVSGLPVRLVALPGLSSSVSVHIGRVVLSILLLITVVLEPGLDGLVNLGLSSSRGVVLAESVVVEGLGVFVGRTRSHSNLLISIISVIAYISTLRSRLGKIEGKGRILGRKVGDGNCYIQCGRFLRVFALGRKGNKRKATTKVSQQFIQKSNNLIIFIFFDECSWTIIKI